MLSRSWLFLSIPAALAAVALLFFTIASLLRTVRGSVIARPALRAEQRVEIDAIGTFAINLEGPLLSRVPSNLLFALSSADRGTPVLFSRIRVKTRVSSMSRARYELYSFSISTPGAYVLEIGGLDPSVDYGKYALPITRPYTFVLTLHVLALIALGFALVGSLIVSGFAISGKPFTHTSSTNGAQQASPE